MDGRFKFTPSCCCGQQELCVRPCVPNCAIVYDGFIFDSETVNPYESSPSFVRVDNREDYYKCGDENWFKHYRIARNIDTDLILPSLENSPSSGWCYRQTYHASTGSSPSSSEDWFLESLSPTIGGLTVSNIYPTNYDSYPHATSLVWYKIMFLPIDTNVVYDCFEVTANTPEAYIQAPGLSLGTHNQTYYCVSITDCLCPNGTDDDDCNELLEYWTLISSCGERYDISTETSSTESWSTNGMISASDFESWLLGTCANKKQSLDYTQSIFVGFASSRISDMMSGSSFNPRLNRGVKVVSRKGLYNYAYEYEYPIIMDNNGHLPPVHNIDSNTTSSVQELNQYVTPSDETYPSTEAAIEFGDDTHIPNKWTLVSDNRTSVSRYTMFTLDRSGSLSDRFAGEYYIYASGRSCGTPQDKVAYKENVVFPLGVFSIGNAPAQQTTVYSHLGIECKERPLSSFVSVNDFITFDETTLRRDKLFIKSFGGTGGANTWIEPDALSIGGSGWQVDYRQDGVTKYRTIKKYTYVATLPFPMIVVGKGGGLLFTFAFGRLFGARSSVTYPLTSFSIAGSAGYGPRMPIVGNNAFFGTGLYAGRILDSDYSQSIGIGNGAVPTQDVSGYDCFIETFSASGSDAYRIITYPTNGHTYAIPKIPNSIINRLTSAITILYGEGNFGNPDINTQLVWYPTVQFSAIIEYEE